MRPSSKFFLASAAIFLAASAALAAGLPRTHRLVLQLPGGGTETITYVGNIAPQVRFAPTMAAFTPMGPAFLMPGRSDFSRMAVAMQNWQAAMQSRMFAASNQGVTNFIAPGGDFCMQEVEIASIGSGQPHMVSHSAGACGATPDAHFHPTPSTPLANAGARLPVYTVTGDHI